MAINVEGTGAQAAPPAWLERRQAEVRQGGWLHALENALLQDGTKKPVEEERSRPQPAHAVDGGQPFAAHAAQMAPAARMPAAADVSTAPEAQEAQEAHGPADAGASVPHAATAPGKAGTTASVAAGAASPHAGVSAAGRDPAGADGAGAVVIAYGPVAFAVAKAPGPEVSGNLALSAYALAGPVFGASRTAANVTPATDPVLMQTQARAPGLNLAAAPPEAKQARDAGTEAGAADADTSQTPASQTPADDYAARLMHLYQGADGVQAWIRDADIDAGQAQGLARSMVAGLGDAGTQLVALTVNGRKLSLAGEKSQDEHRQDGDRSGPTSEPGMQSAVNPLGVA